MTGPQQHLNPSRGTSDILLTIGIFTYSRSALLAKALHAFQTQVAALGATDVEVVVCDNASPDDTEAVAKSFSSRFPHFQYYRQASNIGPIRNLLQAVRIARSIRLDVQRRRRTGRRRGRTHDRAPAAKPGRVLSR
jgi:glycosyltransferase involved in cell wall biosynthesis